MKKLKIYAFRILFALAIIYMCYDIYVGKWGLKSYLNSRADRIKLNEELNRLTMEKISYEKDLEDIKKNPLFIEEQIKINLRKGSKGEIYYLFSEKNLNKSK